jgi:hypothetical protein
MIVDRLAAGRRETVRTASLQLHSRTRTTVGPQCRCVARALVIGGEALPTGEMWRRFSRRVGLIDQYGPTERILGCSIYEVPPGANNEPVTVLYDTETEVVAGIHYPTISYRPQHAAARVQHPSVCARLSWTNPNNPSAASL